MSLMVVRFRIWTTGHDARATSSVLSAAVPQVASCTRPLTLQPIAEMSALLYIIATAVGTIDFVTFSLFGSQYLGKLPVTMFA